MHWESGAYGGRERIGNQHTESRSLAPLIRGLVAKRSHADEWVYHGADFGVQRKSLFPEGR